ncbi:MAG: hypothetical protein WKG07_05715 [Hymenobacter sp.]
MLADRLRDPEKQEIAKLNLAFIDLSSGMFKETFETLASIRPARLDSADKVDFYFCKNARSFSDLADYNAGNYYRPRLHCPGHCLHRHRVALLPAGFLREPVHPGLSGAEAQTTCAPAGPSTRIRLLRLPTLTPHQLAGHHGQHGGLGRRAIGRAGARP